jgi:hypothetical protein
MTAVARLSLFGIRQARIEQLLAKGAAVATSRSSSGSAADGTRGQIGQPLFEHADDVGDRCLAIDGQRRRC